MKTTIVLKYELENCSKCPLVAITRTRTLGAGYAQDYLCKANNDKMIAGYIEWKYQLPDVPEWCPCRIERVYGL